MNRLFQLALILFLLPMACKQENTRAESFSGDGGKDVASHSKAPKAIDARDHIGLYKGVLPCADCEGIETSLYLMANNAYLLTKVYKGLADRKEYKNIGDFEWSEDGTTVTLSNMGNAPNRFVIEETRAIQLDLQGKRVEGDLAEMYTLVKQ
jgi:uncharacterized lipoprotein NlpE involved in copper resistance